MAVSFINSATYDSASSSSAACSKPTNTANDDIMFAIVQQNAAYPNSVPTGWTELNRKKAATSYVVFYWKKAASEGTSYTWGFASASKCKISIGTWRSDFDLTDPILTAVDFTNASYNGQNAAYVNHNNSVCVYLSTGYSTSTISYTATGDGFCAFTERLDNWNTTPDMGHAMGEGTIASAGYKTNIQGTGNMNWSTGGQSQIALILRPTSTTLSTMVIAGHNSVLGTAGSSTSTVLDKPIGLKVNDIMFCFLLNPNGSAVTAPAGWTQIAVNTNAWLGYKVAVSGDLTTYTYSFSYTSNTNVTVHITTYRGTFVTGSPILTYSNDTYTTSNTTLRAGTVTTSKTNCLILFFGTIQGGGGTTITTAVSGYTRTFNGPFATGGSYWEEENDMLIWNSTGATGSLDASLNGNVSVKHAFAVILDSGTTPSSLHLLSLLGVGK